MRRLVAKVESLDLRAVDSSLVRAISMGLIFKGYRAHAVRLRPGILLHRARVCELPTNLSQINYPPLSCAVAGRFNERGKPMFYSSASLAPVFLEVHAKVGDTVALSSWRLVDSLQLQLAGFTDDALAALGTSHRLPVQFQTNIQRGSTKSGALLTKFLARKVTEDVQEENAHQYKLTAVLASYLLGEEGGPIDGLVYPSIPMAGNADNVALRTSSADRCLRLNSVRFVRIDAVSDQEVKFTILDAANEFDEAGVLRWKGRDLQWKLSKTGARLTFTFEESGWVARDASGAVVHPD
jgi:RES domain